MSLLPLLVALSGPAFAQEAEPETLGSVLDDLSLVINKVESEGYQITDITVGVVFDDGLGHSVPLRIAQDDPVLVVAVGDDARIRDVDLKLFDDKGQLVMQDQMADNMPVVAFEAPRSGIYDARVLIADTQPDYNGGFFVMVTSYPSGQAPVTVQDTAMIMREVAMSMEEDGFQILHSEWDTLGQGETSGLEVGLPGGSLCRAVVAGSDQRVKRLNLYVMDPDGNLVGEDRKNGEFAIADFPTFSEGPYLFAMEAQRLRRGVSDAHSMLVVGCQGLM